MTRHTGDFVECVNCFDWRTRHPSGKCTKCRERPPVHIDRLIAQFEAALYVPYPANFSQLKIGCRNQKDAFDKPKATQAVRETCWRCPMYDWCLTWGIENDEQGIWGGLDRGERRKVRNGCPDRASVPGALTQSDVILVA